MERKKWKWVAPSGCIPDCARFELCMFGCIVYRVNGWIIIVWPVFCTVACVSDVVASYKQFSLNLRWFYIIMAWCAALWIVYSPLQTERNLSKGHLKEEFDNVMNNRIITWMDSPWFTVYSTVSAITRSAWK